MEKSILPDIWDVARENGLRLKAVSGRPDEQRVRCPFCAKGDKGYHLYLNRAKGTFNCYRCGRQGGVLSFIAGLTGRSEMSILDDLKEKAQRDRPARRKREKEKHPAEMLTAIQLRAAGFLRRPNWPELWRENPQRARDTANWIWDEWQFFLDQEKADAFASLVMSLAEGNYRNAIEHIRAREGELGISLLEPVLQAYGSARLPAWAREGKNKAEMFLKGAKCPPAAG